MLHDVHGPWYDLGMAIVFRLLVERRVSISDLQANVITLVTVSRLLLSVRGGDLCSGCTQ